MATLNPKPLAVPPPPDAGEDPVLYRVLISGLVAAVILTICAVTALAALQRPVPEGLVAIGSACAGGLVGLLIPSPVR